MEGEALVRLVWAEALAASGRDEPARDALAAARRRLLERSERISDPGRRECFLGKRAVHARTLALRW
jgi:eukaryotic-like serine/threonine-protein kinase